MKNPQIWPNMNEQSINYPTYKHYKALNSKLDDIAHLINQPLTKIFNQSSIRDTYPMIDHIDVYELEDINFFILRIYVNDPEMDDDNMYEKGLDPHYLVDYHFRKFLPYFGIDAKRKTGFAVVRPDGEVISKWMN